MSPDCQRGLWFTKGQEPLPSLGEVTREGVTDKGNSMSKGAAEGYPWDGEGTLSEEHVLTGVSLLPSPARHSPQLPPSAAPPLRCPGTLD